MAENLKGCSVPCKLSLDQLQTRCRQEKVSCKLLGVSKNNINDYEVEYLCDYKRMKDYANVIYKCYRERMLQKEIIQRMLQRENATEYSVNVTWRKISQTSVLQVNAGRTHTLGSLAKLLRSKKAVEFYLVKWKDYPESENTWEPRRNLKCVKLLRQFQEDLEAELRRRRKRGRARLDPGVASSLVQRARQRQRLQRWEALLNATRNHKGRIFVRNDADLDGPPRDFTYINNYKTGDGIALTEVAVGCECQDCLGAPAGGCCARGLAAPLAYNERGQVRLRAGLPIYECNSRCRCAADCPNRVVQRGIQYDLCIFKTHDGRGWGVRTMEHIRKNCFVMEYVGEIITTEEAERRGHIYDRQGATYLFDLDYVEDVYTVDAAHYGNISHFVNHSCNPNLQVYNVFIDNLDERLPRIAFFSTRPIRAGEELTFDYKMQIDPVDAESTKMDSNFSLAGLTGSPKSASVWSASVGVESCRKYLF